MFSALGQTHLSSFISNGATPKIEPPPVILAPPRTGLLAGRATRRREHTAVLSTEVFLSGQDMMSTRILWIGKTMNKMLQQCSSNEIDHKKSL